MFAVLSVGLTAVYLAVTVPPSATLSILEPAGAAIDPSLKFELAVENTMEGVLLNVQASGPSSVRVRPRGVESTFENTVTVIVFTTQFATQAGEATYTLGVPEPSIWKVSLLHTNGSSAVAGAPGPPGCPVFAVMIFDTP